MLQIPSDFNNILLYTVEKFMGVVYLIIVEPWNQN